MKQSNPKKAASKARTPSPKPLQKKQVSSDVLSMEKNPCLAGRQAKSETLVIAKEQSDRSNLRDASGLLLAPRRDRNDKGASGNDKGVSGNDKSVGAWNFKSWHKIFAAEKARSKTFTFFQTARNTVVRGLDRACGFALRLSAGFLYSA